MPTPALTGIAWVDWIIIIAAVLAALSTIYYRGIRPLRGAVRRLVAVFGRLENVFDMSEELSPTVRGSLFATQARLVAGHDEIMALLKTTNERIDAHMDAEEASLSEVATHVAAINERFEAAAGELEASLAGHMATDEKQFLAAHTALAQGQTELVKRLSAIEEKLS